MSTTRARRGSRPELLIPLLLGLLPGALGCAGRAAPAATTATATAPAATTAAAAPAAPARGLPAGARAILVHGDEFYGDGRVGTYLSSTWGFSTASYWIEGPDGLVVVDAQFLPSAAAELLDWAERATGKQVKLAVVLHANPDKFNGTAVFQKRGIRVVTSAQVLALIPKVHEKRLRAFYDRYQPDYPKEAARPESFGDKTTELRAAGLVLKAHVLGAGCSEAHVALEWEGHLFTGDLVASGAHSWLEIGRTDEWLKRLEELRALDAKFVHPGRGLSGDGRLLDQEEAYLRKVIAAVAEERPKGPPREDALERARKKIAAAYLGHRFEVFLNIGLPAEWRRQAAQKK